MAAESTKSSGSADSYLGCFISLISKVEIRYEGFLFHINPQESTIGLRNVKSFGTEGRRKDGPQVLPSDKVYEYIFFRGSDIKDLQVISSPPVQSSSAVPNDPAIIQTHYPDQKSASSSFPSATNISSNAQLVLPNSTFQGNLPLNQPVGSLASWGSLPSPPTANGNGIAMPTYWPGHSGSSGEVSHLQQQPLLRPSHGSPVSPLVQQQMQNPTMNASLPGDASKFSEFSRPMLPTIGLGSPSLTSTMPLPSALLSSVPIRQPATLPSKLSSNLIPNNASNALPPVTLGSNTPLASPLTTSSLDVNPVVLPITDKPKSVVDPALPHETISQSMPSIGGLSSQAHSEGSIPSLLKGHLLHPGPTGQYSLHLQAAHKDIEVVQASTSELLSSDSKSARDPALPLQSSSAEKLNGAVLHNHRGKRRHVQGRGNTQNKTALCTDDNERDHARGKRNWLNTVSVNNHRSDRGRGRGKGTQVSPTITKFTEDFDFEAMNEKFNKEEIWGHLGKSIKTRLEDYERVENDNDANDLEEEEEEEDEDGLPNFDEKPVYVKDDFFDSLSYTSLDRESGRGRAKFSEQRRIDIETFGEIPRHRRGHSSRGPGWGGQSRGFHRGRRGYGYIGRGRGRGLVGVM